jgi:hypothetical protein
MRDKLRTIAAIGCVAALVTLLAVSAAAAGPKAGRYEGTTSQGETISFKAKELGVKKIRFTVVADCEDGTRFRFEHQHGQAPTSKRGRFEVVFTGDAGTTVLKGRLKRRKGSGTFETEGTNFDGASCTASGDWGAGRK